MSENLFDTNENIIADENTNETSDASKKDDKKGGEFKFFKSCSATLKRFSVILFVINLFITITIVGVGIVLLAVYIGAEMLTLLALPIFTVSVILVLLARFVSALVYGFAEIVEKHENK